MLWIWDICSGSNSVAKAYPNRKILAFDIKPVLPLPANVTLLKNDITTLTEKNVIYLVKKYPPSDIWFSPICKEFTAIKNSVHTRDMILGFSILIAGLRIICWVFNIRPIKFFVENPDSKISRRIWTYLFPFVYQLSYCKYDEIVTINGHSYHTFPIRKHTILGSNVPGLSFKRCKNDCNVLLDGRHLYSISFLSNPRAYYYYYIELRQHGLFLKYTPSQFYGQVPAGTIHSAIGGTIGNSTGTGAADSGSMNNILQFMSSPDRKAAASDGKVASSGGKGKGKKKLGGKKKAALKSPSLLDDNVKDTPRPLSPRDMSRPVSGSGKKTYLKQIFAPEVTVVIDNTLDDGEKDTTVTVKTKDEAHKVVAEAQAAAKVAKENKMIQDKIIIFNQKLFESFTFEEILKIIDDCPNNLKMFLVVSPQYRQSLSTQFSDVLNQLPTATVTEELKKRGEDIIGEILNIQATEAPRLWYKFGRLFVQLKDNFGEFIKVNETIAATSKLPLTIVRFCLYFVENIDEPQKIIDYLTKAASENTKNKDKSRKSRQKKKEKESEKDSTIKKQQGELNQLKERLKKMEMRKNLKDRFDAASDGVDIGTNGDEQDLVVGNGAKDDSADGQGDEDESGRDEEKGDVNGDGDGDGDGANGRDNRFSLRRAITKDGRKMIMMDHLEYLGVGFTKYDNSFDYCNPMFNIIKKHQKSTLFGLFAIVPEQTELHEQLRLGGYHLGDFTGGDDYVYGWFANNAVVIQDDAINSKAE